MNQMDKQSKEDIIEQFYTAFAQQDAEKMVSFYADEIVFSDPAFGTLKGEKVKNMWRMLMSGKNNTVVTFGDISSDEDTVVAKWSATYTFSQTGKSVVNNVCAKFVLDGEKIVAHHDNFNLHKWAKQALGFKGWLMGGTGFFQKQLNKSTNNMLTSFEKRVISKK
jgi:ketosteroid isomerase-like protein